MSGIRSWNEEITIILYELDGYKLKQGSLYRWMRKKEKQDTNFRNAVGIRASKNKVYKIWQTKTLSSQVFSHSVIPIN